MAHAGAVSLQFAVLGGRLGVGDLPVGTSPTLVALGGQGEDSGQGEDGGEGGDGPRVLGQARGSHAQVWVSG